MLYRELSQRNPRSKTQNAKLICILGSAGGGRDAWKRPKMGEIAATYCDEILLTDEDPYDEPPEAIVDAIADGVLKKKPDAHVQTIVDRREAVRAAISLARERDTVVITGKGSETAIHRAHGEKEPWSDRAVALEELQKRT
jgi:UDP-N-acetylmuramoyl-L-alanyl-D-glutamate--2,6-diaminopimelate ligase